MATQARILGLMMTGHFVSRYKWNEYGFKNDKGFDNVIYKLKKKGLDIRDLDEQEGKVYYMKQ